MVKRVPQEQMVGIRSYPSRELINAKKNFDGRKMIIEAFKNKIFPLSNPDYYPEYTSEKDTLSRSSISNDSEDISPRSATDKSDFTADDLDNW